jgi:NADPH:quinone reductase-like Zn-dependent oxidoreductase
VKSIQFEKYGEPAKVLTVQERPLPEPGKEDMRVRILASPVNPSDLLFVRGHYGVGQGKLRLDPTGTTI